MGRGGALVASLLAAALLLGWWPDEPAPAADGAPVRYGRDVRGLLSDRCFPCHGADGAARRADLRLDVRALALAGREGGAAIVPGDPQASALWRRVSSHDPDARMPPPEANRRPLDAAELEILRRWIEQGAPYEEHWAFVAPQRPALPEVADAAWPSGPIDRFVLARLEAAGVAPSPEADRATLARRVFLDLTGLPPTLAELDAFLGDEGGGAYERLVERLLTTEPYRSRLAEHLAAPWLDAARYADTIGIHTDNGRQHWLWRDWVLEAFRDGMPYDRFVTEQLAGDLLPEATAESRVATGFLRGHVVTDEGGAIDEEYLLEYAVDRVNTTSTVLLGLTMGCARCHDHKFDPLTQEDFYGLLAFFNSNDEPGLYTQTKDSNRAYEPFLEVPSPEQRRGLARLDEALAALEPRLEQPLPGEEQERAAFLAGVREGAGLDWSLPEVVEAASSEPGVTFDLQPDGSLLVGGNLPDFEEHHVTLRTDAQGLRLLLLEGLAGAGAQRGPGRAFHGNVVLTGVTLAVRPLDGPATWSDVPLHWAWADHSQGDRDFVATNALRPHDGRGWAADHEERAGPRVLLFLSEAPFGFPGGSELRVTLAYRSEYPQHSFGRLRLRVSPLADSARLPVALGRWYEAGPFRDEGDDPQRLYDVTHGPETLATIDRTANFGAGNQYWRFGGELEDERVVALPEGVGVHYLGRELWSPDARQLEVALGSDDGFQLWLDGALLAERRVDRGAAPDQDRLTLPLRPGHNALVLAIVNTGGESGYAFAPRPGDEVLEGELAAALLPPDAVNAPQQEDLTRVWRRRFSAGYAALEEQRDELAAERALLQDAVPRAMVMAELEEPRQAHVLLRGQYDQPDASRPVERATPAVLPPLPPDAPRDRLGLARWLVDPGNPLFARVAVNRFWEQLFGVGLVRTSEDFGLQGDWPTHPELLDWLALEFRASGWDVRGLLRQMVLSSTYRQDSRGRPELVERDPDNRLLAAYPRRRLSAEQIRDLALHVSGLLVERLGGPSVKSYQPEGLWREVAMTQSNTRDYERGAGDDLWRRSLYSYWKRAVPPPALQTFDAPTRESCVVRRQRTNTPLQALVLWNDEQFVEAARALAANLLRQGGQDDARLVRLFRAATGRLPETEEQRLLAEALADFRGRFAGRLEDAAALLAVGERPPEPGLPAPELAAWTMLASGVLCLHETLTQD